LRLSFGDARIPVALVGPAREGGFMVEFLLDPAGGTDAAEAVRKARKELDRYLLELKEPDPWAYAVYHCGTASNLYSSIHWEHRGPMQEDGDA
jgi:hypothetical protein